MFIPKPTFIKYANFITYDKFILSRMSYLFELILEIRAYRYFINSIFSLCPPLSSIKITTIWRLIMIGICVFCISMYPLTLYFEYIKFYLKSVMQ